MEKSLKQMQEHSAQLQAALKPGNLKEFHQQVVTVAGILRRTFTDGHVAYVAGNGGSAAQAQHISDEMLGRYKSNRGPYPVMALNADGPVITCIGNDFGFEDIFSRQVAAVGHEGDVFIGLSTSGESKNIIKAVGQAKSNGLTTIALTGSNGRLKDLVDHAIIAPAQTTARMQEMHLHAIHLICELLEE